MTQYLPPNLLALFAPRDPVPYLPPLDKLPHEKKNTGYTPIGFYVTYFEDPKDTPPPTRVETREERLERKRREKQEQAAYKLEQDIALWDPITNPNCTTDPYKTLFVARINYDTSESKLRREFEVYGSIKKIHLVHDVKTGKPRGYAFIEYEHERDMHYLSDCAAAYKHADGKKIDGRRVLVDVERARTVKGWLPRRLGGGLGGTRRGGPDVNIKHSGREEIRGDERERVDRPERGGGGGVAAGGGGGAAVAAGGGGGGGGGGDRERERGERRRSDSRNRERAGRRNRSRSRSRERDGTRTRRERRNKRSRDRSRDKEGRSAKADRDDEKIDGDMEMEEAPKRKRSRSRDRERKRRRSRSRSHERERKKRDRSRRDRDRDHEERSGKVVPAAEVKDEYSNGPTLKEESNEDYNNSEDYSRYNESQYGEDYEGELDDYNGYQIKQED